MDNTDKQGLILGQIRFDRNNENKHISIDKSVEGHGIASQAIKEGLKRIKNEWGSGLPVCAQCSNKISVV